MKTANTQFNFDATFTKVKDVVRRNVFPLFALGLLMLIPTATKAEDYTIIGSESSIVGDDLVRTVYTVQVGTTSLDQFRMTRVAKDVPNNALKGVIMLMPPLGSGFQNYEVGENGDYNNSFVAYFARRNYAVLGYSQRVQGLVAGSCESGAVDCSAMAGWTLAAILEDVQYIREQSDVFYPGFIPIVGGLSLGSIISLAAIDENPNDYSGAILIDGTIYDTNPAVQAINAAFTAEFDNLIANGIYYDGQGLPGFKLLSQLASVNPNGLTPFPTFPPFFTNHQAFVAAVSNPPLSPATFRPGFFNFAGSVEEDRLFFANEALVHANIAQFVDYVALATWRDLLAGLSGDRTYTDNLDAFSGPVIMFAAGGGFGPAMQDTAGLMTSANVTFIFNGDYGHVDFVLSAKHHQEFEKAILNWLQANF